MRSGHSWSKEWQTVFFRMVCAQGGQDPQWQKAPTCLKRPAFSGILRRLWRDLPLSETEVRNLNNTVWKTPFVGHFLRGRSLKGRCNIRVYVPVYVPVCVCVCVCVCVRVCLSPPTPPVLWGWTAESFPTPSYDPPPPFPHPYPQAIARATAGKNYPLESARVWNAWVD